MGDGRAARGVDRFGNAEVPSGRTHQGRRMVEPGAHNCRRSTTWARLNPATLTWGYTYTESVQSGADGDDRPGVAGGVRPPDPAGASWTLLRHARTALPILEKSRLEWADHSQVRDYAMCVARLSAAYADVGDLERACATAEEVLALAQGLGSRRVAGQIGT